MTMAQQQRKQERLARRRRIQQAAREMFGAKGYAKTSIEHVAQQASLSVGAIYLYFRSKEDLYTSLLEDSLDKLNARLAESRMRHDQTAMSRLRGAWTNLVDWALFDIEGTRTLRLLAKPDIHKQLSSEVIEGLSRGLRDIHEHLAALISAGVEANYYHTDDAETSAALLWSLFIGVIQAADTRSNIDLPGLSLAESARAAFDAFEAGIRAPRSAVAEAA